MQACMFCTHTAASILYSTVYALCVNSHLLTLRAPAGPGRAGPRPHGNARGRRSAAAAIRGQRPGEVWRRDRVLSKRGGRAEKGKFWEGPLAEVNATQLRRVCLANMPGELTQSVLKRIIRQVGVECAAQGQSLSETLVAFMVSATGSVQGLAPAEAVRGDLSLEIPWFPIAYSKKF